MYDMCLAGAYKRMHARHSTHVCPRCTSLPRLPPMAAPPTAVCAISAGNPASRAPLDRRLNDTGQKQRPQFLRPRGIEFPRPSARNEIRAPCYLHRRCNFFFLILEAVPNLASSETRVPSGPKTRRFPDEIGAGSRGDSASVLPAAPPTPSTLLERVAPSRVHFCRVPLALFQTFGAKFAPVLADLKGRRVARVQRRCVNVTHAEESSAPPRRAFQQGERTLESLLSDGSPLCPPRSRYCTHTHAAGPLCPLARSGD